jgi:hypothetical protein
MGRNVCPFGSGRPSTRPEMGWRATSRMVLQTRSPFWRWWDAPIHASPQTTGGRSLLQTASLNRLLPSRPTSRPRERTPAWTSHDENQKRSRKGRENSRMGRPRLLLQRPRMIVATTTTTTTARTLYWLCTSDCSGAASSLISLEDDDTWAGTVEEDSGRGGSFGALG